MANNLTNLLTYGAMNPYIRAIKQAFKDEFGYDGTDVQVYCEDGCKWYVIINGQVKNYAVYNEEYMLENLEEDIWEQFRHCPDDWLDFDDLFDNASEYLDGHCFDDYFEDYVYDSASDEWDEFSPEEKQQIMDEGGYDDIANCEYDWINDRIVEISCCYENSLQWAKHYDPDIVYEELHNFDASDLFSIFLDKTHITNYEEDFGYMCLTKYNNELFYYHEW